MCINIYSHMFPLIKGVRATNYLTAFLLNGFVTALIAVVAIEMRVQLENPKSYIYGLFNALLMGKDLSTTQIMTIVFITTLFASLVVYHIFYFIFHYGGGFMIPNNAHPYI